MENKSVEDKNSSLKLIPKFEVYMQYMLKVVLIQLPRVEKFSIGTEYKTLMYDTLRNILLVDNFLEPFYFPQFIDNTYACIPGRGMHKAAKDVQNAMKKCKKEYGDYYILKMDVSKYFPSINKEILLRILKRKIKDKDILWLISQTIFAGRKDEGIPIGNLSSQLFANLYYNEADQFIKHKLKVRYYFRYMDDSIILMKNKEDLKRIKLEIEKYIAENLKLKFNDKTNIFKAKQGVNFCGYKINEYRLKIREKGKRKLKNKVKKLTYQIKNGEMTSKEAKKYLCGHYGYMNIANVYNLINKYFILDETSNYITKK